MAKGTRARTLVFSLSLAAFVVGATVLSPGWPPSIRSAQAAPSLSGCGSGATVAGHLITIGTSATNTCTVTLTESPTKIQQCVVQTASSSGKTNLYLLDGGTLGGNFKFATQDGSSFTSGDKYIFVCNF